MRKEAKGSPTVLKPECSQSKVWCERIVVMVHHITMGGPPKISQASAVHAIGVGVNCPASEYGHACHLLHDACILSRLLAWTCPGPAITF